MQRSYKCFFCVRSFDSPGGLKKHARTSIKHETYLGCCDRGFLDEAGLNQHRMDVHCLGPVSFTCCDCSQTYFQAKQFGHHLRSCKMRGRPVFPCEPCEMQFRTKAELSAHLCSKEHRPVSCLGNRCKKKFRKFSDMVQHLESGGCASRVSRAEINALVRGQDRTNVITMPNPVPSLREAPKPAGVQGGGGRNNSGTESRIVELPDSYYDTDSDAGIFTPSSTASAFPFDNGYPPDGINVASALNAASSQHRCPDCHRLFRKAEDLAQHRDSPVHAPFSYHCPKKIFGIELEVKKKREFKTLSGLTQHMEAGACFEGVEEKWQYIGRFLEVLLRGMVKG